MRDKDQKKDLKDQNQKQKSKEEQEKEHWNKKSSHKAKLYRVEFMILPRDIYDMMINILEQFRF